MMTEATLPSDSREHVPNEKTVAAMLDARDGSLLSFDSVADLIAELNTGD